MLKRTLLASYLSQAYVSLVGLLLMPVYLRHMGVDGFALIGVFWMLQILVQVLDFGLTPSVSREISRFRAGALTAGDAWQVLCSSEAVLALLATMVLVGFLVGRDWLARHWLGHASLPSAQVAWSLVVMVMAAALRWQAGLYRGGMVGLERQVWVSANNMIFATARFIGVVPVILFVSSGPLAFFVYQVFVSIIELIVVRSALHRTLPPRPAIHSVTRVGALRLLLPVALPMALMGGIWILQTQVDKLLLSKLLSLRDFAHFTLASMVAGAVLMIAPPLNQVLQPRLTILAVQDKERELSGLYSAATQYVAAVVGALGLTLAFLAKPLLLAWTGDPVASDAAAPVLVWYALANSLTAILILPFTLQFARGHMRLQVLGSLLFLLVLLPSLYLAVAQAGAVGAGKVLFALNVAYLLLWVPLVHRKLLPDGAGRWIVHDVSRVVLPVLAVAYALSRVVPGGDDRWKVAAISGLVFVASAAAGILSGSRSRPIAIDFVRWKVP